MPSDKESVMRAGTWAVVALKSPDTAKSRLQMEALILRRPAADAAPP